MPNYLVIRVAEMPTVGQGMSALVRVENAPDEPTAGRQALAAWREQALTGVVGTVLASQVNRRTFAAPPPPDFTVT